MPDILWVSLTRFDLAVMLMFWKVLTLEPDQLVVACVNFIQVLDKSGLCIGPYSKMFFFCSKGTGALVSSNFYNYKYGPLVYIWSVSFHTTCRTLRGSLCLHIRAVSRITPMHRLQSVYLSSICRQNNAQVMFHVGNLNLNDSVVANGYTVMRNSLQDFQVDWFVFEWVIHDRIYTLVCPADDLKPELNTIIPQLLDIIKYSKPIIRWQFWI